MIPFDAMICQYCGYDYRAQLGGPGADRRMAPHRTPPPVPGAGVEPRQSQTLMLLAMGIIVVGILELVFAATWWIDIPYEYWKYIEAGAGIVLLTLGVLSLVNKK